MKTLLVIDGQGGGCGRTLIEKVVAKGLPLEIIAAGTNAAATTAMLKAGAAAGATGENAVVVNCRRADIIAGPMGILIADGMMGECTPAMAVAVGTAAAKKVLVPAGRCGVLVAGVPDRPLAEGIEQAVALIAQLAQT